MVLLDRLPFYDHADVFLSSLQQQKQQQQQLSNSPLSNRPQPFNQNTFPSHMNQLRSSNYLNGSNTTVQNNSPKMLNSGTQMFNAFDQRMNSFQGPESTPNFPANCDNMSPNNMFGTDVRSRNSDAMAESEVRALRMKLTGQQQKPPAYTTTQPMTHYAGNPARHQNPGPGQQQHRPVGRQFQNNPGMRLQMSQVQQVQQPRQHNAQQVSNDILKKK